LLPSGSGKVLRAVAETKAFRFSFVVQPELVATSAFRESYTRIIGSLKDWVTPNVDSVGPTARTSTYFLAVPEMKKPPISGSVAATVARVDTLISVLGAAFDTRIVPFTPTITKRCSVSEYVAPSSMEVFGEAGLSLE
jgi:hypothetical protein